MYSRAMFLRTVWEWQRGDNRRTAQERQDKHAKTLDKHAKTIHRGLALG